MIIVYLKDRKFPTANKLRPQVRGIVNKMIVVIFTSDKVIKKISLLWLPLNHSTVRCHSLKILVCLLLYVTRSPTQRRDYWFDQILIARHRTLMFLLHHPLYLRLKYPISLKSSVYVNRPIGETCRQVVAIGAEFRCENILNRIFQSVFVWKSRSDSYRARRDWAHIINHWLWVL